MIRRLSLLVALHLTVGPACLAQQTESTCEVLLGRVIAQEATLEPGCGLTPPSSEEKEKERSIEAAYERALWTCANSNLDPATRARVERRRAEFLLRYRQDDEGARRVLESALQDVTEKLGDDSPARVALLEDLADLYGSNGTNGRGGSPGADGVRAREMAREALRVRRTAFGERSLEAAQGLIFLAFGEIDSKLDLAERRAWEALEIARGHRGGVNQPALDALLVLAHVMKEQGRQAELEAVREASSTLSRRLVALGEL